MWDVRAGARVTYDEILRLLKNVKRNGDRATARCPAHEDHDNSLSITKGDDGKILTNCFAGCTVDDICGAIGIEVKELFPQKEPPRKKKPKEPEKPLTVEELAKAKGLPVEWLREQGVENFPDGSGVAIGYFDEGGSQHARIRKRTSMGKGGWSWQGPQGVAPIPYGLWRLKEWRGA